jgi:hypothetical protein
MALTFSLSIIPVQRAAESFTRSVSKVYVQDLPTQLIFAAMGLFTGVSFVFGTGVKVPPVEKPLLFCMALLLFFISINLLRLHYRRICSLLTLDAAISRVGSLAIRRIERTHSHVTKLAPLFKIAYSKRDSTLEQAKTAIYSNMWSHQGTIVGYTNQLMEMAYKALVRGEIYDSQKAVTEILKVVRVYVGLRKANIVFHSTVEAFFVWLRSDLDNVLDPIYAKLAELNQRAIQAQSEDMSVFLIDTIAEIGSILLEAETERQNIAFHTAPAFYMKELALYSHRFGYVEPIVRASSRLMALAKIAVRHRDAQRLLLHHLESWDEIVFPLNTYKNGMLMNLVYKHAFDLAHHLVREKQHSCAQFLEGILEKTARHIEFAGAAGILSGRALDGTPNSYAYDVLQEHSLFHIMETARNSVLELITQNDNNPYDEFNQLNDKIWRHFRYVGENINMGASHLSWYITFTIQHFVKLHIPLLDRDIGIITPELTTTANNIAWYANSLSHAMGHARKIKENYAAHACDILSWIALVLIEMVDRRRQLHGLDIAGIILTCISNISAIAKAYYLSPLDLSLYKVADFMIDIEHIRRAAVATNLIIIAKAAENALNDIKTAVGDNANALDSCYNIRRGQFEDRLGQPDAFVDRDMPTSFLRALIRRKQQKQQNRPGAQTPPSQVQ